MFVYEIKVYTCVHHLRNLTLRYFIVGTISQILSAIGFVVLVEICSFHLYALFTITNLTQALVEKKETHLSCNSQSVTRCVSSCNRL